MVTWGTWLSEVACAVPQTKPPNGFPEYFARFGVDWNFTRNFLAMAKCEEMRGGNASEQMEQIGVIGGNGVVGHEKDTTAALYCPFCLLTSWFSVNWRQHATQIMDWQ